jgi:tetratricopeptide (TPR) repeat protein
LGHIKVMATALSKLTYRYQSQTFALAHSPVKKITAYTCGLVLTGSLTGAAMMVCAQASSAADFTHAQHVFVPPTSIPRHYDSESLNYGNATGDSPDLYPSSAGMGSTNGATVKTTTQNGKSFSKTFYDGRSPQSQPTPSAASSVSNDAPPAMNAFVTQARSKAQALVKQGKLAAAEDMLQTDLKAVPKSQGLKIELANVRVARAKFALKTGNSSAANQYAESALAVQPSNPAAKQILAQTSQAVTATTNSITEHLNHATNMIAQDDFTGANREIQAALHIRNTAEVHSSMGDLAAKQGNVTLAKAEYAKALQLDPNSVTALRQAGLFKVNQNDLVGANKDLSRALYYDSKDKEAGAALQKIWHEQIAKNPSSSNAHLGLARAYQLSDELQLAQVEYKEVVRLEPQHPSIPAARQSFKLALAKQESIKCCQAAKTLEDAGALTEAHQKAIEAVNISPTCVSARIYQGTISQKLKLYTEAHDAFMTALRYDPKNAIAARHLKALQGLIGDGAAGAAGYGAGAGIGAAATASSNIPSTPNVPPGMYVFRGWQYGHPLANNANNGGAAGTTGGTDASQMQTQTSYQNQNQSYQNQNQAPMQAQAQALGMPSQGYGAAQTANYSGSSLSAAANSALATSGLSLPGGPTAAQLADPAAPMPLQGTPPVASSTTPHVNAFSSFLGSLRDLQTSQKQQTQQAESAMSSYLNPSGYGSSSAGGLGSGLGSGLGAGLSGAGGAGAGSGSSSGIASAIAGAGTTNLPPVNTPSASSISSILAQAHAAIAGAGGTSSTGTGASATGVGTGSGAGSSTAGQSSSVSTSVAAIPTSATGSASTAGGAAGAGNSGQSISGAAWDAAPAWVKQKFPNMTQADFTALAGRARGTLRSRLQALAAQQKAASMGQGQPPTADDALAGLLPPGVTVAQLTSALNSAAPGASTAVLANLMPPSTGTSAADLQGEQDLIAKAGQDSPTTPPPDVVPTEAVVQTAVVRKAKAGDANSTSSGATTAASSTTAATADSPLATDINSSAAGSGQPVGTSTGTAGLTAETPTLAAMPPASSTLRPAITSTSTSGAASTTDPLSTASSRDDLNNDNSNASVVLELQGYNPTPSGIKLKVVIKNSRTKSLPLPDSARAVIHMPGQPDKEARVTFSAKEVTPGGTVQGIIKVAGHDLNPSADLVLPNFLPMAFADRDVHLTVPISALVK